MEAAKKSMRIPVATFDNIVKTARNPEPAEEGCVGLSCRSGSWRVEFYSRGEGINLDAFGRDTKAGHVDYRPTFGQMKKMKRMLKEEQERLYKMADEKEADLEREHKEVKEIADTEDFIDANFYTGY